MVASLGLENLDGLLPGGLGATSVAQRRVHLSEPFQRDRFARTVPDAAVEGQGLLVVVDGLRVPPGAKGDEAEAVQGVGLASPVAEATVAPARPDTIRGPSRTGPVGPRTNPAR